MATQSEQILEDNLVIQLISQRYAPVAVTDEAAMLANLKTQLEAFNGLPLVQIELKRRGLEMKEAFNQIQRYQKHSLGVRRACSISCSSS